MEMKFRRAAGFYARVFVVMLKGNWGQPGVPSRPLKRKFDYFQEGCVIRADETPDSPVAETARYLRHVLKIRNFVLAPHTVWIWSSCRSGIG